MKKFANDLSTFFTFKENIKYFRKCIFYRNAGGPTADGMENESCKLSLNSSLCSYNIKVDWNFLPLLVWFLCLMAYQPSLAI